MGRDARPKPACISSPSEHPPSSPLSPLCCSLPSSSSESVSSQGALTHCSTSISSPSFPKPAAVGGIQTELSSQIGAAPKEIWASHTCTHPQNAPASNDVSTKQAYASIQRPMLVSYLLSHAQPSLLSFFAPSCSQSPRLYQIRGCRWSDSNRPGHEGPATPSVASARSGLTDSRLTDGPYNAQALLSVAMLISTTKTPGPSLPRAKRGRENSARPPAMRIPP